MSDVWGTMIGFVPSVVVLYAVLKQSKNVSALAQLGSIAQRSTEVMEGVGTDEKQQSMLHHEAEKVKDLDKLIYTMNTFNVGLTCFLVGRFPHYFHLWHIPKVLILTGVRWWLFKGEKKHYLLYDFCYWANGLSMFYTLVTPTSGEWFQVLFLIANGPLAWSILAFSQSVVLHDIQRMISVFIHTSPMMLTLCLRWSPSAFVVTTPNNADGIFPLLFRGVLWFYLPWVAIYYCWVFIFLAERVRSRGYQTLYDRVMGMTIGKRIAKVPDSTGDQLLRKAVYMLCHLFFGSLTMFFAAFMYHSQVAHWTFALCVLAASAWNGASFYSKVWATKYNEQVREAAEQRVRQREPSRRASSEAPKQE